MTTAQTPKDLLGKKVFVYLNLHKMKYSIRVLEGEHKGRVKHWDTSVYLKDVTQKISEKGRQRVIAEKCKNVHAGLVGYLTSPNNIEVPNRIRYNPYYCETFVYDNGDPYTGSDAALLSIVGGSPVVKVG